MKILVVNSDPLSASLSVNKRVCQRFIAEIKVHNSDVLIEEINLYESLPPYFSEQHYKLIWDNPAQPELHSNNDLNALQYIKQQCAKFKEANAIILSAPIWNSYVPAILKAWIDMVITPGYSYEFSDSGINALHNINRVITILSAGGYVSKDSTDQAIFHLIHKAFAFVKIEKFDDILIEAQEPSLYSEHSSLEEAAILELNTLAKTLKLSKKSLK